jgi:hypothetical protein
MLSKMARKQPTRTDSRLVIRPELQPAALEPDALRDAVRQALLSLPQAERSSIRDRLLSDLRKAGIDVTQCLFMLGAAASTVNELTPPEIAALIRYVRIIKPNVIKTLARGLGELLATTDLREQASESRAA